jgi:dnd system-associated protein 4
MSPGEPASSDANRFYVQKDKHHLFQQWGKEGEESTPFATLKDAFVFAASVGWAYGAKVPLRGTRQQVGFWDSFNAQLDVPVLESIAIAESGEPAIVADRGRLIHIAQEYANAGIDLVNACRRGEVEATVVALVGLIAGADRSGSA